MTIKRISPIASLLFAVSVAARAQAPAAAPPSVPRTIYVQDFQAQVQESSSSRGGPLSRLRSGRSDQKAWQTAGSLSGAIADQFKAAGYTAQRIPRSAPLPDAGWLVTGVFYALDSQGKVIQLPSFLSGDTPVPPNTQVTVSVADLAGNPAAPFIVFGKADALRGQGPPVGLEPLRHRGEVRRQQGRVGRRRQSLRQGDRRHDPPEQGDDRGEGPEGAVEGGIRGPASLAVAPWLPGV